jgi:hypothetical protein
MAWSDTCRQLVVKLYDRWQRSPSQIQVQVKEPHRSNIVGAKGGQGKVSTLSSQERTSEDPLKTKFAEIPFHALG